MIVNDWSFGERLLVDSSSCSLSFQVLNMGVVVVVVLVVLKKNQVAEMHGAMLYSMLKLVTWPIFWSFHSYFQMCSVSTILTFELLSGLDYNVSLDLNFSVQWFEIDLKCESMLVKTIYEISIGLKSDGGVVSHLALLVQSKVCNNPMIYPN